MDLRFLLSRGDDMTVRIFIGNDEDVKELADEYPLEASVIEEMLKAAEQDTEEEQQETSKDT